MTKTVVACGALALHVKKIAARRGWELDVRPIHRPGCGALEVHTLRIVPAAVTGALEFVLARLPVRRAAQVRANRRDHKDPFRVAHHPDAVLVLEFGVHAEAEIGRIADFEIGLWLEQRARKEEAQEHHEIDGSLSAAQKARSLKQARHLLLAAVVTSRKHFDKEERIVFPLAERVLNAKTLAALGQTWMERRTR